MKLLRAVCGGVLGAYVVVGVGLVVPAVGVGAVVGGQGTTGVSGEYRAYRLVHVVDGATSSRQELLVLPSVPEGVEYTRGGFAVSKKTGEVWGVLLRSDGRLVGYGKAGQSLVLGFEARHPGLAVVDMAQDYAVVLSDGRVAGLAVDQDGDWAKTVFPAGERRVVGFLANDDWVFVRADGRGWSVPWEKWLVAQPARADRVVTKHAGYLAAASWTVDRVNSCWKVGSGATDLQEDVVSLVRNDGRAEVVYPHKSSTTGLMEGVLGGWAKSGASPNTFKDPMERVPRIAQGMRYVSVTAVGNAVSVFLRSDGRLAYRGALCTIRKLVQPPVPAKGLRYVDLDARASWPRLTLLRSDGALVSVDPQMRDPQTNKLVVNPWQGSKAFPTAPRSWRFLNPRHFRAMPTPGVDDAASGHRFFVISKVRPGDAVDSGIRILSSPRTPVAKGNTARVRVQVVSHANLKGGKVVVTTASGKVVGQATVAKANGKATVAVKTTALKKARQTLNVQYLGNNQAKKTGKAQIKLTITK
ncbi:MAG: hypothetical protein FWD59_01860 [Micrococcales bacterium]|nr:hypothetical protein [Micrococcales bacterium]